jgi:hypothetical protein
VVLQVLGRVNIQIPNFSYVVLVFFQLFEESRILRLKEKSIVKKNDGDSYKLIDEIKKSRMRLCSDTVVNMAYFPLTVHWSLENSNFPDIGVGLCGTIAAITQLKSVWRDMFTD